MNFRLLMPFGGRTPTRVEDDPFFSLQREVNRVFDDMFRAVASAPAEPASRMLAPRLDVKETDGEIKIAVELPGVEEKDIEVSLEQDTLTIRGEKRLEREEKDKGYHLMERSYGSFLRQVGLPADVDRDKVEASLVKGVLTVTLKKKAEAAAKAKKIEIRKS